MESSTEPVVEPFLNRRQARPSFFPPSQRESFGEERQRLTRIRVKTNRAVRSTLRRGARLLLKLMSRRDGCHRRAARWMAAGCGTAGVQLATRGGCESDIHRGGRLCRRRAVIGVCQKVSDPLSDPHFPCAGAGWCRLVCPCAPTQRYYTPVSAPVYSVGWATLRLGG